MPAAALEMFRQMDIPIIGVVENMSYLELPDGQKMDIFGSGGGEKMAQAADVKFLGAVPMDPAVREGGDSGKPIVVAFPESKVAEDVERYCCPDCPGDRQYRPRAVKEDAVNISIS